MTADDCPPGDPPPNRKPADGDDGRGLDHPSPLDDAPQLDLAWEVDDPVEPSEPTVFDPNATEEPTTWITADVARVLPLEEAV